VDKLVVEKLVEQVELFDQELVEGVDDGGHHAGTVGLDRIEHLLDPDGLDLLGLLGGLDERLSVDIVVVLAHVLRQLSQQAQDVDALLQALARQVRRNYVNLQFVLRQDTHVLVGLEVVRGNRRHLVKNAAQVPADFFFHAYLLLKEINVSHHSVFFAVKDGGFEGVILGQVGDNGLMNLEPDVFFDPPADRLDDLVLKALEYLFLIVVDGDVGSLEMLDVPKHLEGIIEGHKEVVHLVGAFVVTHDHVEDERE